MRGGDITKPTPEQMFAIRCRVSALVYNWYRRNYREVLTDLLVSATPKSDDMLLDAVIAYCTSVIARDKADGRELFNDTHSPEHNSLLHYMLPFLPNWTWKAHQSAGPFYTVIFTDTNSGQIGLDGISVQLHLLNISENVRNQLINAMSKVLTAKQAED